METKVKQLKNEYYKQYRAKNKDKIRAINERYWQKKVQQQEGAENK